MVRHLWLNAALIATCAAAVIAVAPVAGAQAPTSVEPVGGTTITMPAPQPSAAQLAGLTAAQRAQIPTRYVVTTGHSIPRPVSTPKGVTTTGAATESATVASATSYCGSYWYTIYSYNGFGQWMWWYQMTVPWCWTTGVRIWSITAPYVRIDITWPANLAGWEWDGVQSTSQYKLNPTPTRDRSFTQGKFGFCTPRVACLYRLYPYLTLDVDDYGRGFMISSGGTSL